MKKKHLLAISIFLYLIAHLSRGQSSGPTAPEYTSFEPISATDLVQLTTGDFTYQIPLMEIPGKTNSFPISLHYHAGIQPEQESSWIGLGWNLNVGAINRFVNLFPDDLNAELDESYTFWEGGETKVKKSAIFFPQIFPYKEKVEDTFKGTQSQFLWAYYSSRNGGFSFNNVNYEQIVSDAVNILLPSPEGERTTAAEYYSNRFSVKGVASAYLQQSLFEKLGPSGGNSGGNAVAGSRSTKQTNVSSTSSSKLKVNGLIALGLINPVLASFGIKEKQTSRYWIDDRSYTAQTGSLYRLAPDSTDFFNVFDATSLPRQLNENTGKPNLSSTELKNRRAHLGALTPSFDTYQVLSPSVGGYIAPQSFEQTGLTTGNYEGSIIYQETDTSPKKKLHFRYQGEMSTGFRLEDPTVSLTDAPEFNSSTNTDYFNEDTKRLAGKKHIEWFTNEEINNGVASEKGFVTYDAGSTREYLKYGSTVEKKIGGFMITDEYGVTYHFSLPVYTYENFQRFEQIDPPQDKKLYKHSYIPAAYAYTWLLTGITGSDYRNTYEDGAGTPGLDDKDDGYWVRFDYGMWTNQHKWRTPYEGYETDIDGEFQSYSRGKKELYFLDRIVTATHTALLIKEVRKDGKGISEPFLFEYTNVNGVVQKTGEFNEKGALYTKESGVVPNGGFTDDIVASWIEDGNEYEVRGAFKPTSTLRLKEVVLFKNDRLDDLLDDNGVLNRRLAAHGSSWNHQVNNSSSYEVIKNGQVVQSETEKEGIFSGLDIQRSQDLHLADNVIDTDDILSFSSAFYAASLQSVKMNTDYSLMSGTPNSFKNTALYDDYVPFSDRPNSGERSGKLTLKSVTYAGRGAVQEIPETSFTYHHSTITYPEFGQNGRNYTKTDNWGYYHHLLNTSVFRENNPLARMQTTTSASWKDAWSLASIQSPTGSTINMEYESDAFTNTLFDANLSLPLTGMEAGIDTLFFDFAESESYRNQVVEAVANHDKYKGKLMINLMLEGKNGINTVCGADYSSANHFIPVFKDFNFTLSQGNHGFKNNKFYLTGDQLKTNWEFLLFQKVPYFISYNCNTDETEVCATPNPDLSGCKSCPGGDDCGSAFGTVVRLAHGSINLTVRDDWKREHPIMGGGIRLKQISVNDKTGKTLFNQDYEYENGFTSYEPRELAYRTNAEATIENILPPRALDDQEVAKENFKFASMGENRFLFALGDLIPSPGVNYKAVNIIQRNNKNAEQYLLKERHVFTLPEDKDVYFQMPRTEIALIRKSSSGGIPIGGGSSTMIPYDLNETAFNKRIKFNAVMGLPKKFQRYDSDNNLIFEQTNHYLHEEVEQINMDSYFSRYDDLLDQMGIPGRIDQQYYAQRKVIPENSKDSDPSLQMIVTQLEDYPAVLVGSETYDLKYGLHSHETYQDFDWLTGASLRQISESSIGEVYEEEQIPAHMTDRYEGIGSKFFNIKNKNMLKANAEGRTFQLVNNIDGELEKSELIKADATIWSNSVDGSAGNWHQENSYEWAPRDFEYSGTNVDAPIPPDIRSAQDWKMNAKITKTDHESRLLEKEDLNGIRSSMKIALNDYHYLLQANNASYDEVAFSSAEYFDENRAGNDGGVTRDAQSVIASGVAHTGNFSLGAGFTRGAFQYTLKQGDIVPGRAYRISVWVFMPGFSEDELSNAVLRVESGGELLGEFNPVREKKSKEWYLIEAFIQPDGSGDVDISCANNYSGDGRLIYFDDFRVQPADASMTCYVYDNVTDEITHIFDNNHLYTKYEYDSQGRLKRIFGEFFHPADHLISERLINYKN
ncbi:MAG: hypothetical protein AAGA66_02745 [Bacteroidota bacterium]